MHLPSLANIGVTQRCHSNIPMCQRPWRGNCELDTCRGALLHGCQGRFTSWLKNICSRARGLQTMICMQEDQQGSQCLRNIWYVCKHVVGKDIMGLQGTQNNTLFICRNRPPPLCANWHPYDSIQLIFRGFAQSAATSLLKNKHYFTSSCIFLSPGDVSITAIATPTAKRWTHPPACHRPQPHASLLARSKMPLPPPMPRSLLFGGKGESVLFKNGTKLRTVDIDFF